MSPRRGASQASPRPWRGSTVRAVVADMAPFLFQCPNTRLHVQGWLAEEIPADNKIFRSIECVACRGVHLVNPATGKVLGRDDR